jgi:hypothetical protein
MKFKLKKTTIEAVQWNGTHTSPDAYKEVEETFGIIPRSGRIGRMLNNVITIADVPSPDGRLHSVLVRPGQWIVLGLMPNMMAMDDDLFCALFAKVPH